MSGIGGKIATQNTSGGGISPQQQAAAEYMGGEQAVSGANTFSQIPISTNQSWATGVAPPITTAYDAMRQSDADAAALQASQASAINSTIGGVQSAVGGLGSLLGGK